MNNDTAQIDFDELAARIGAKSKLYTEIEKAACWFTAGFLAALLAVGIVL